MEVWKIVFLSVGLFLPVVLANSSKDSTPYKVVCYLGSWANYRPGDGKFVIEDIDPSMCTHLIYGFAKLSEDNKIGIFDPYLDLKENYGLGAFDRFNALKKKNPNLKTLIAIGGWNEGSSKYSQMSSDPSSRKKFVESVIEFLKKYGFDGLDVDWEYPANRGGQSQDKQNYVSLLKELKEAFQKHGFLLSAAVAAGQQTVDTAYDIPKVAKYLDFINLMAYDFHGSWDKVTGHNAPLFADSNSVDSAVKYWMLKGAPAKKIILGMPLYGRSFTLQDPQNNRLGAPISGPGNAGEITKQPGMLGYNEICKMIKDWNIVFDKNIQAPYAYKDNQWICYDNEKSIAQKVNYIKKMKLGGGMVWSLETDDFRGTCSGKKYPLLRTIQERLNGEANSPSSFNNSNLITPRNVPNIPLDATKPSTTERTTNGNSDTETDSKEELPCPNSGYYRHPKNCKKFYYCQPKSADSKQIIDMFNCPDGTVYSKKLGVCVFPSSEPGCSQ